MGKQSRKKRQRKAPGKPEMARRAQQRAPKEAAEMPRAAVMTDELRQAAARSAETRDQAIHIESRDWREVKIQGREAEIVDAVERGDTVRAKQILAEVRDNAGGCDICRARPAEGEGYVLSTTQGRVERRWGHRECLTGTADRWFANGQAPVWTAGTSIFSNPTEESTKHEPASPGHPGPGPG